MTSSISSFFWYCPFVKGREGEINQTEDDWKQAQSVVNKDLAWRISVLVISFLVALAPAAALISWPVLSSGSALSVYYTILGVPLISCCTLLPVMFYLIATGEKHNQFTGFNRDEVFNGLRDKPHSVVQEDDSDSNKSITTVSPRDLTRYGYTSKELAEQLHLHEKQRKKVSQNTKKDTLAPGEKTLLSQLAAKVTSLSGQQGNIVADAPVHGHL